MEDQATRTTEETPESTAPPGDGGTPESIVAADPARSHAQQESPPEAGDPPETAAAAEPLSPPEGADPPHDSPPDPRDAKIAELEATTAKLSMVLKEAADLSVALRTQHALDLASVQKTLTDSLQSAASRYKAVVLQVHTDLPPSLIEGGTIDQVEASIVKAKTIVQHVRDTLTAQAAAQVPGGAPVRGGPDIDGMSPIDKIKYSLATRKK